MGFFDNDKATLTTMILARTPERMKELMDKSIPEGAEAFGMQLERLDSKYRTEEVYRDLFTYAKGIPTYATNYRIEGNEGKSDDVLAEELVQIAECGAELCDMMGDYFDPQPCELTENEEAIAKQMKLIERLHEKGAKVLMSSHILKYTPAERVLEIALEYQRRGADICKLVTGADTMEEQIENLKIVDMLKQKLDIPFLFLCVGECGLLRRVGGELGCCMYLCVHEYDDCAAPHQPLLKDMVMIRDTIKM